MFEIAVVAVLIVLNGMFSLSELSVVSARRSRLQAMADEGRSGAKNALALSEEPGRFLSTVQIGITLIGILTGAFSGATIGGFLAVVLTTAGVSPRWAEPLGFSLVVIVITYVSIVAGELVPKRLALRSPEIIACTVAPVMTVLIRIATPIAWLLDASTSLVFRLLGIGKVSESAVTDEEIHSVVAEAASAGVIDPAERHMISGVMRLGDRPVRGIMTPRTDVDWIDLGAGEEKIRSVVAAAQHSHLPVGEGSSEVMLGVLPTRGLLSQLLNGQAFDIRACIRPAPVIPDTAQALDALSVLREAVVPMALVHDEYGHFEGVVTPSDVLEAIAGVFRADADTAEPGALRREDGSWLLGGWLPIDELAAHLSLRLPAARDYHTTAGYILSALGRLPRTGEHVVIEDWRFEIVDLDGNRIDKVIAAPAQKAT
ncbi:MAG: HlyC/CorC family transporter [Gemmatimonadaceae bacterium]|nr:HlyC/CorC family transporter [Acetobacteraceae bacterium]